MKEENNNRIIINGLHLITTDNMMEMFYTLIIAMPEDVINYDESLEKKIAKIDNLLAYLEETEQYEKCIHVKNFKSILTK